MAQSKNYKSWIPANSGRLSIDRISKVPTSDNGRDLTFQDISTYRFSDSFSQDEELPLSYTVTLKNIDTDFPIAFDMKLYGGSSISSEERKILSAQGRIEQNGLVVFKISFASENIDENSNLGNIPNTVYTILKNIIHSDNHHDVAVDNVIPVVPEEEYSCDNVLEGLLDRIKKMEYQAKHEIRGFPSAPHSVLESYQRARGFQSYYLAFRNHHCERSDIEEREGDVENVLTSFKSLAELAKQRLEKRRFTTGVLLTLAAILVSTNMLVKSGDFNIGKHLMDSGVTILQFNFALLLILFFIYLAIDIATTRYIPSLAIWIKGVSWEKKKRWLAKMEAVLIWFYSKHPKFGMLALVLVVLMALLGLWIALVALF